MQQPANDNLLKPKNNNAKHNGDASPKDFKEKKNSQFEYTYTLLISLLN